MEWIAILIACLFVLLGAVCVLSIIFGIPGGWIILGLALLIQACDRLYLPAGSPPTFDSRTLIFCAVLLLIGELIEIAAGAAGAKRGGGSRRATIGALVGGVIGAVMLTGLIPIPIVGSLIGALVGTFAGALIGEMSGHQPKTLTASVKPALGAMIGRVMGTCAKIAVTIAVWITLSVAAFFS